MKTCIIYTLFLVTINTSNTSAAPKTLRGSPSEIIAFEDYVKDNEGDGDELIKEDNLLQCTERGYCCHNDSDCCGDLRCVNSPIGLSAPKIRYVTSCM